MPHRKPMFNLTRISLLMACLALPATVMGTNAEEAATRFAEGTAAFENGAWEKAAEHYDWLVRHGFQSAALYYNLGNLHYRRGQRGLSVLWYERARRLAPRDPDVVFNLGLARSHLKEPPESLPRRLIFKATEAELGWTVVLLLWIVFGLLGAMAMAWVRSETWPGLVLGTGGALLLIVGSWFVARVSLEREAAGVVIAPPGEVRNGPGLDYAVGFTIPEGSRILILTERPGWTQIGVPHEGLRGWMPSRDVDRIAPNHTRR